MAAAGSDRPSVDQYFMDMTHLVKARGTCPRRQVGAVIVKDKRVLTTGYNGAPRNFPHPIDVGCLRDELKIPHGMVADICPCLHAEQNAIIQAATTGVSIEGAELFCTTQPCTQCSRMVANCGVKRVVYEEEYPDPLAIGILTTAGVELWRWDAGAKKATRLARPNTFQEAQDLLRKKYASGGPLPMAPKSPLGGSVPAPRARETAAEASRPGRSVDIPMRRQPTDALAERAGAADGPAGAEPDHVHTRDISRDPEREALLRRLAREKVERKRRAALGK